MDINWYNPYIIHNLTYLSISALRKKPNATNAIDDSRLTRFVVLKCGSCACVTWRTSAILSYFFLLYYWIEYIHLLSLTIPRYCLWLYLGLNFSIILTGVVEQSVSARRPWSHACVALLGSVVPLLGAEPPELSRGWRAAQARTRSNHNSSPGDGEWVAGVPYCWYRAVSLH